MLTEVFKEAVVASNEFNLRLALCVNALVPATDAVNALSGPKSVKSALPVLTNTLNVEPLPFVKVIVLRFADAVINREPVVKPVALPVKASNAAIDCSQLALSAVYDISSTNESIISVLNPLKRDGVIAPALLFGNSVLFATFKACFEISAIVYVILF